MALAIVSGEATWPYEGAGREQPRVCLWLDILAFHLQGVGLEHHKTTKKEDERGWGGSTSSRHRQPGQASDTDGPQQ